MLENVLLLLLTAGLLVYLVYALFGGRRNSDDL